MRKVNHKFIGMNGELCDTKHPVFGNVGGVCSIKQIEKDLQEELKDKYF